jgi:hypothetical protein
MLILVRKESMDKGYRLKATNPRCFRKEVLSDPAGCWSLLIRLAMTIPLADIRDLKIQSRTFPP